MRIFLTGATGFAGSHLVDRLLAGGHEIFALVHEATSHQQLPVNPQVQEIAGDLLQLSSLKKLRPRSLRSSVKPPRPAVSAMARFS